MDITILLHKTNPTDRTGLLILHYFITFLFFHGPRTLTTFSSELFCIVKTTQKNTDKHPRSKRGTNPRRQSAPGLKQGAT